jgi:hypothetical protein
VIKLDKLLGIYEETIKGMVDHLKSCENPRCCIRLVGKNVVLGNYQGYIKTDQPIKEMPEKKGKAQLVERESQYHRNQGSTEVMP